jgi:VCBS repeat-containing protein
MTVDEGYIVTELDSGEDSVLANDFDPDSTITVTVDMDVSNGTLILYEDGTFSYEHNGGETTADSFTYIASDGDLTDTATVEIIVVPVNDPPVAYDDSMSVADGGTTTILDDYSDSVLDNDVDPDSIPTAILDVDVSYGELTLNEDGTFSYTHDGTSLETDFFTYIASDGVLTDTATVTITIIFDNDPPVANSDSITLLEGGTSTELDTLQDSVLANDMDPDPDTTLIAVLNIDVNNGELTLEEDGTFSYTHDGSETTSDSFTYIASDGQLFDIAVVNISITPVNDPPVAMDDEYTTKEDTPLIIDTPGVISNDSDIDSIDLSTALQNEPSHGSLEMSIDGSFTYTPTLNFNGVDTFTYNLSDGYLTASATVTITVTAINDAPEAEDDSYDAVMNETLTVLSPGVLHNDVDIENDSLTAILEDNVVDGVLNFNSDGSFSYKPPDNFIGKVSFSYKIFDGELESNIAIVEIDVSGDNIAPEVSWIWPDLNQGEWIEVGTQIFPLEVYATDNVEVDYVLFRKWDPAAGDNGDWVDLGTVSNSPYRLDLDTSSLHEGFNQITALAYDSSGNSSESYIFLKVWRSLIYLPAVSR